MLLPFFTIVSPAEARTSSEADLDSALRATVEQQQPLTRLNRPEKYRLPLLERFLSYVQVNSQSQYGQNNTWLLSDEVKQTADFLYAELQEMAKDANQPVEISMSEEKYIYVHFPSNLPSKMKKSVPVLGFSSHYDVTPEAPGKGVRPIVHHYNGGEIVINEEKNIVISPQTDPYLAQLSGETVITASGDTLLGADDKAGTSIMMTLVQTLLENPQISHGELQFVFTPNEDVGQSAWYLDLNRYNPEISFDFDGEVNGEIMAENFTAEGINVTVPGRQAHPAEFKEKNGLDANQVATRLVAAIPNEWWPQYSSDREPYLHPYSYDQADDGTVYIAMRSRYFDKADGDRFFQMVNEEAQKLSQAYDINIKVERSLQYENVAYGIHPLSRSVAQKAMQDAGAEPQFISVRGGTTAAMFNAKWGITGFTLPTGQQHEHSVYEWLSEKDMFIGYKSALNIMAEVVQQSLQNAKK